MPMMSGDWRSLEERRERLSIPSPPNSSSITTLSNVSSLAPLNLCQSGDLSRAKLLVILQSEIQTQCGT